MKTILMFIASSAIAGASYAEDFTKPYDFVSEIIKELNQNEIIKMVGAEELKEAAASGDTMQIMAAMIRQSTRQNLELRANINTLKGLRLKAPSDGSPQCLLTYINKKSNCTK